MNLEALATAARKVVGVKQTGKALQRKQAITVFLADDAGNDAGPRQSLRHPCRSFRGGDTESLIGTSGNRSFYKY